MASALPRLQDLVVGVTTELHCRWCPHCARERRERQELLEVDQWISEISAH